jgi:hypothetical protein
MLTRRFFARLRLMSGKLRSRSAAVEPLESRRLLTSSPYHNRGWVSVIIENTIAAAIEPQLAQFKLDLIADGWTVAPDAVGRIHDSAPRMDDEFYVWHNEVLPLGPVTLARDAQESSPRLPDYKDEIQYVKDLIEGDRLAAIAARAAR